MKKLLIVLTGLLTIATTHAQELRLNELDYFERQGVNVLVFSNSFNGGFNDEKNSGIEIIHHGVRTVQGGAVRLNNTPEQWDLVPQMTDRKVDREKGTIEVALRYADYDFNSRIVVTGKGKAVEIAVWLDKPVPEKLAGEAGLNIEFLPSQYWLKTYTMDGRLGRLPRYATSQTVTRPNSEKPRQFKGFKTYDDRGTDRFVDPLPLETGHRLSMATDDPSRLVTISSDDAELKLFDGRMLAQNGWFVVRSVLPKGKTGKVVTWTVEPHAIPGWIREPNIGFSQVGYIPEQPKVAVIELDKNDPMQSGSASLMRLNTDGTTTSGASRISRDVIRNLQTMLDSIPMKDAAYKEQLRPAVQQYAEYIKSFDQQNPYGVPIGLGNWAGVNAVLNFGITVNYAHIYFPDIVSKDEVYRVANWLYGCHPYHNYSFVAVVGAARPKQVFYGNNRADFSAIPGNVAPGLLFRKPDHFENFDDWPFLWGQDEGTIAGNTQYVIFGSSFKNIVSPK